MLRTIYRLFSNGALPVRHLKNFFGPLFPVFATACLSLVLLSISRLGLSLWQWGRVCGAGDGSWWKLIFSGIRVDVALMGWMMFVPAIASALLLSDSKAGQIWRKTLRVILTACLTFIFFMELATPSFIAEYGLRPNRLFFEYLVSPKEVISTLIGGHLLPLIIVTVFSLGALYLFWRWTGIVSRNLSYPKAKRRLLYAVLAGVILFAGARSTFHHRPLNPSMVAFSSDPLVNSLAVDSSYSVLHAALQMTDEENSAKIYGKMPTDEMIERVKKMSDRDPNAFVSQKFPTLTFNKATGKSKKNIVIVLLESHGAQFVESLGGAPLSPNIDKLAQESWYFEKCFAMGTRSVRGIEAVITGFTPTPARAVVKLGKSQEGFFTLASLLSDYGYHTSFIYGGEKHFDNMASFFYGNGFEEIIDEADYKNPIFTGSWGVCDEDLFAEADKKFSEWESQGKPFFSLVFTSSNHDPYEFPSGRVEGAKTRESAVMYADYALGKFFETAKKSSYWKDTIFLVVADHDARASGASLVPINNFHIPAFFIGEGVPVKKDPQLISQIDLPTTLLSLAGIDAEYPMLGYDLTRHSPNRALMMYDKNFALMEGDKVAILMPSSPARGYVYDYATKKLSPTDTVDPEEARDALAIVLWGTYAYNEGLFRKAPKK